MIDIYIIRLSPKFDYPVSQLSPYRLKKYNKINDEQSKQLCLAGGYLLNEGLKKYGLCEKNMEYYCTQHGKPYFKNADGIYFSLSHSKEMAACAFSDSEIGLDIQKVVNIGGNLKRRVLTEGEALWVNSQKSPDAAFTRLWCLKESLFKYTGLGISQGFNTTQFKTDNNSLTCVYKEKILHFIEKEIGGYYLAACCGENFEKFNITKCT